MIDPVNKERCRARIGEAADDFRAVFSAMTAARSEKDVQIVLDAMDRCCGAMQEATFALERAAGYSRSEIPRDSESPAGYKRTPTLSTCGSCGLPRVTKVAA